MGLLDKLKKLFKGEEESIISEEKPVEQEPTPSQQHPTLVQQEPTQHKIEVVDTAKAIETWEKTLQAVQQHPLSQVKIINTQILEELSNVLKSMDSKMNKLHKLDKLDQIYEILLKTQSELESKGIRSEHLNAAMAEIERLTIKDKDVIDWISKQEQVTAQQLADRVNLSRSTASFRLNRLAELGVLDRAIIGKRTYYKIKNMPKLPDETKGLGGPEPSVQTGADEFD